MQFRYLFCLCTFSLVLTSSFAVEPDAPPGDPLAAIRLNVVLQHASEMPESPYHLQVNCTDQKGIRSFELFPGGTTIWNRRSQVILPTLARSALLKILVDRGFPGFVNSYGGSQQPAKSAAPARITCRILIEIQNLEKSSVQMAGGEQFAPFLNLAAELLDQVEQYADSAVTPVDLQDALDKLSDGQLAPQVLHVRFVSLPTQKDKPGSILRLGGGQLSHQVYTPGRAIAEPTSKPLKQDQFKSLITGLQTAQLASLPANLWSEDQLELEVQVLAHKKIVLARRFTRLESARQTPAQQRFDNIVLALRDLAQ